MFTMITITAVNQRFIYLFCVLLPNSVHGLRHGIDSHIFGNTWAVTFHSGVDPDKVASEFGFENYGEILKGVYEFRSLEEMDEIASPNNDIPLAKHRFVSQVEHQEIIEAEIKSISMRDPFWSQAWHINVRPEHGKGMNISGAWQQGYFGQSVTICHVDNGVDYTHSDLRRNFRQDLSFSVINSTATVLSMDPTSHGTMMAGLSVAEGNNSVCAVGVAPRAVMGMVQIFEGTKGRFTSAQFARALSRSHLVDIYVLGFGAADSGGAFLRVHPLELEAIQLAIARGRQGKGTIIIQATGNGGLQGDSCSFQGHVNLPFVIGLNSAGESGSLPKYTENCTAILGAAYGSGDGSKQDRRMATTQAGGGCTDGFTGTSSSSAVAGGVAALLLSANKFLTWRDVQHILIRSADPSALEQHADWNQNGVGRWYSRSFGYGLIDAGKMVTIAKDWSLVDNQISCSVQSSERKVRIPAGGRYVHSIKVYCGNLRFLEHVLVVAHVDATRRGDIDLTLKSPMGTRSKILRGRKYDYYFRGIKDFPLKSVEFWEEDPDGTWELIVSSNAPKNGGFSSPLTFRSWKLELFGTASVQSA